MTSPNESPRGFKASEALDYPLHYKRLFVIWTWNRVAWPDGAREIFYLTDQVLDPMKQYAMFTIHWQMASTFVSARAANRFLQLHEGIRGRSYGVTVTTVETLRKMVGFDT